MEGDLRVGEEDQELGAGQALVRSLPLSDSFFVRELLELAIELTSGVEVVDEPGVEVEQVGSLSALEAQRQGPRMALAEDVLGDGVC